MVIAGSTDGIGGTSWLYTEWQALLSLAASGIVTLFIGGTIIIGGTLDLNTGNILIALETRRTIANCSVELHFAECSGATNRSNARVNTLLRHAGFVEWTVIVGKALIYKSNVMDQSETNFKFLSTLKLLKVSQKILH